MIDQLKSAICKTVKQFQEHPLDFLSESDIQALLFIELRNATGDLRYPYDAEDANRLFGFTDPFCIHPVTTEYHVSEGKFDIAVLSKEPDSDRICAIHTMPKTRIAYSDLPIPFVFTL